MTYSNQLSISMTKWLEEKPNRTVSMLGRLSDVSYSTVRRVLHQESVPSKHIGLSIASVVMPAQDYQEFADKYWPLHKKYADDVPFRPNQNKQGIHYMLSESHCKIIVLATALDGINEVEVRLRFGISSVSYFHELVEVGLLKQLKNGNYHYDEDLGSISSEITRSILINLMRACDRKNDQKCSLSTSWVGWESINEQSAKQLSLLSSEFHAQASRIIKDPSNRGNIVMFAGVVSNSLNSEHSLEAKNSLDLNA